jgi:hypothetical protein
MMSECADPLCPAHHGGPAPYCPDMVELPCFFCGRPSGKYGFPRYGDLASCDECLRSIPDAQEILREYRITASIDAIT